MKNKSLGSIKCPEKSADPPALSPHQVTVKSKSVPYGIVIGPKRKGSGLIVKYENSKGSDTFLSTGMLFVT